MTFFSFNVLSVNFLECVSMSNQEKANNMYKNLSEEEKEARKEYSKNRYKEMKKMQIYFLHIKMSEQTLKFGDIMVNKKDFHASKQAIALNLLDITKK